MEKKIYKEQLEKIFKELSKTYNVLTVGTQGLPNYSLTYRVDFTEYGKIIAIIIPEISSIIAGEHIDEEINVLKQKVRIMDIRQFQEQVIKGNPDIIELIYSELKYTNPEYEAKIMEIRDDKENVARANKKGFFNITYQKFDYYIDKILNKNFKDEDNNVCLYQAIRYFYLLKNFINKGLDFNVSLYAYPEEVNNIFIGFDSNNKALTDAAITSRANYYRNMALIFKDEIENLAHLETNVEQIDKFTKIINQIIIQATVTKLYGNSKELEELKADLARLNQDVTRRIEEMENIKLLYENEIKKLHNDIAEAAAEHEKELKHQLEIKNSEIDEITKKDIEEKLILKQQYEIEIAELKNEYSNTIKDYNNRLTEEINAATKEFLLEKQTLAEHLAQLQLDLQKTNEDNIRLIGEYEQKIAEIKKADEETLHLTTNTLADKFNQEKDLIIKQYEKELSDAGDFFNKRIEETNKIHDDSMQELKEKHSKEVSELLATLKSEGQKAEELLKETKETYEAALSNLHDECDNILRNQKIAYETEVEKLNNLQEAALNKAEDKFKQECIKHEQEVKALKQQDELALEKEKLAHNNEIKAFSNKLQSTENAHKAEINKLQKEYSDEKINLENDYKQKIQLINSKNSEEKSKYAAELQQLAEDIKKQVEEYKSLEAEFAAHKAKAEEREKELMKAMSDSLEHHKQELELAKQGLLPKKKKFLGLF